MGQQYQPYYSKRHLCWDEENRLVSFADCENAESERVASQVGKGRFAGMNVSLADSASTAAKLLVAAQIALSLGMKRHPV